MLSLLLLLSSSSNEPEWLLQLPLFGISFWKHPSVALGPTGHVFSSRYSYYLKTSVLTYWSLKKLFSDLFTENSFFFLITILNLTTKLLTNVVLVLFLEACRYLPSNTIFPDISTFIQNFFLSELFLTIWLISSFLWVWKISSFEVLVHI